jgi:twitching motility protein PilT
MDTLQPRRLIGEAMLNERLITKAQLEEGLNYQAKVKKLIGESLVELGYIKEGTLLNFLAGFFSEYDISPGQIKIIEDIADLFLSDFKKWLIFMVNKNASDLHLIAGMPPRLRINGELVSARVEPLSSAQIKDLIYGILTDEEMKEFEKNKALDKSYEIEKVSRYRINLHWQKDSIGASIRALPLVIPDFKELGIPEILKDFVLRPSGLVIVTGPAGSGKSTTLASVIEFINTTKAAHIVTIEDPIEYVFESKRSLIRQRELGKDTLSYKEALRSVVRQDPNVIFIGEMRDLDTIQAALVLAETGHLILSTLHTQDATHSINRIVDVFPSAHQHEIRTKLALTLQGVVTQQLIPRCDAKGRVLACEILNCIPAVRNLIRENSLAQMRSFIQMGSQYGMRSMNHSLFELYNSGIISWEEAYSRSTDRDELLKFTPKSF